MDLQFGRAIRGKRGELVAQGMLESVYTEVVDVLSTQSMRAPEVVKGMRESMVR